MHGTERPRALLEHGSKKRKNDVRRSRNVIPILACHWAALLGVHHYSNTFSHTLIHSLTHSFIHSLIHSFIPAVAHLTTGPYPLTKPVLSSI